MGPHGAGSGCRGQCYDHRRGHRAWILMYQESDKHGRVRCDANGWKSCFGLGILRCRHPTDRPGFCREYDCNPSITDCVPDLDDAGGAELMDIPGLGSAEAVDSGFLYPSQHNRRLLCPDRRDTARSPQPDPVESLVNLVLDVAGTSARTGQVSNYHKLQYRGQVQRWMRSCEGHSPPWRCWDQASPVNPYWAEATHPNS